jgi:DNA polymerase elongation subunit (family B)
MQLAVKEALNSVYGAIGNQYFRYYDLRMAESITLSGQLSNRWNANMLDEYFNKANKTKNIQYVIAGDTDSNMVTLETIVESTCTGKSTLEKIQFMNTFSNKIIEPLIDRSYVKLADYMNAYEQKMLMKLEKSADVGVFVAKKRYFLRVYSSEGVQYAEPKLKVTGLELVKSSTPQVCRKKLKDSLNIILDGDQDQINKYVNDFKIEFESLASASIGRPSGINGLKKFSDKTNVYAKGTPMHVRGALWYNHLIDKYKLSKTYEKILDSDKVKVVFLRTPNPINQNVISIKDKIPEEFGLEKYIDYDTQFEKVFINPLQIMLEPIGWKLNNSANLDDFFG